MTTAVDLCNRALSDISARSTISSLTEGSNEAIQCGIHYTPVQNQLLRMADWSFASKTATLTLLKALPGTPENPTTPTSSTWNNTYPAPPWLYSYGYPSDCLRGRKITPQIVAGFVGQVPLFSVSLPFGPYAFDQLTRWKKASDVDANGNPNVVILTDQSQAIFTYTARITTPDIWDDLFQAAFVAALAAHLAVALTNDKTLANMKIKMANDIAQQARAQDGNEGPTVVDIVPDWIQTRGYARNSYRGDTYYSEPFSALFGGW